MSEITVRGGSARPSSMEASHKKHRPNIKAGKDAEVEEACTDVTNSRPKRLAKLGMIVTTEYYIQTMSLEDDLLSCVTNSVQCMLLFSRHSFSRSSFRQTKLSLANYYISYVCLCVCVCVRARVSVRACVCVSVRVSVRLSSHNIFTRFSVTSKFSFKKKCCQMLGLDLLTYKNSAL